MGWSLTATLNNHELRCYLCCWCTYFSLFRKKKHIKLKLLDRIIPIDLYYYSTTWSCWVTNDLIEKISWTVVIKDDWCNKLLNDGSEFFYTDFFTYFVCSVVMFTVDSICKIVQNKIKLDDVLLFFITGIPRLTRFFLAGFHFTQIFAKICIARFYITYKISVLWEFFWQFFFAIATMIRIARISCNVVFWLPKKTH